MNERERRIGLNEAFFREVNEHIEDLDRTLALQAADLEIVCECARADCFAHVTVPRDVYEHVRSDSTLFLALPGHVAPDAEDVLEEHGAYVVLRKRPDTEAAEVAEATDPRKGPPGFEPGTDGL